MLCFGKLEDMRDLIPVKTRRKRRFKVLSLPEDPLEPSSTENSQSNPYEEDSESLHG